MKYLVNRETKEHFVYYGLVPSENWDIVEADAEGWIKWEGGECPLPDGVTCDIKDADSNIRTIIKVPSVMRWSKIGSGGDIIAYRPVLDKPEVIKTIPAPDYDPRSVSFNVLKRLEAAHEAAQRIPEIEAELRETLGKIGYDLVRRSPFVDVTESDPLPDMTDWRNWRVGDLVEVVNTDVFCSPKPWVGDTLKILEISETGVNTGGGAWGASTEYRFHSRPEAS